MPPPVAGGAMVFDALALRWRLGVTERGRRGAVVVAVFSIVQTGIVGREKKKD